MSAFPQWIRRLALGVTWLKHIGTQSDYHSLNKKASVARIQSHTQALKLEAAGVCPPLACFISERNFVRRSGECYE